MRRNLNRLAADTYDVLIIGGGIYGICTAWDAAQRGLSVALVEKEDFGHATSSNSLRVIHGGLRYLQHGDLRRLRQSIEERMVFMRIAPHLVHPLPFLIPTYGHALRGREILALALRINDAMGSGRNRLEDPQKCLPSGRLISKEEALTVIPGIDKRGLTGAAVVYDCQMFSSERLILAFARSAANAGAQLANYVEVFGLLRNKDRVAGVNARDRLNGAEIDIRAKVVVNCSGPWLDRVVNLGQGVLSRRLILSKAFNILINRQLISRYAVGIYAKNCFKDRDSLLSKQYRMLFITPWQNRSLIGTVHLPYDCDPDRCAVTEEELQAFISQLNAAYPAAAVQRRDVCFIYGGLLPMGHHKAGEAQLVKRYRIIDHKKEDGVEGLISVMGVKFTEARHVAEKTIELVFRKLGESAPKSSAAKTLLHGGQIQCYETFLVEEGKRKPSQVSPEAFRRVLQLYGSAYPEVLKYLDSSFTLAATKSTICQSKKAEFSAQPAVDQSCESSLPRKKGPQTGNTLLLRAEVIHGIREEMAHKLTDVVFRRTSLGLAGSLDDDAVSNAASVMSDELGWDAAKMQSEVDEVKSFLSAKT